MWPSWRARYSLWSAGSSAQPNISWWGRGRAVYKERGLFPWDGGRGARCRALWKYSISVSAPAFSRVHPRVICDLRNWCWALREGSGGARGNLPLTQVPLPFFTLRAWQGCRAELVRASLQLPQTERLKLGFWASSSTHLSNGLILGMEGEQHGRGAILYS